MARSRVRWLQAVSGVHGEAFIMWVRMGSCSLERLPPPRLSRYLHWAIKDLDWRSFLTSHQRLSWAHQP
jgi:hypothetical protein